MSIIYNEQMKTKQIQKKLIKKGECSMKKILCPCCPRPWWLLGTGDRVITEVKLASQSDDADYYIKCQKCKNEIAVKKVS